MKAIDLISHFNSMLEAQHEDGDLSARQLREIHGQIDGLLVREIKLAPCEHDGSRWGSRGKIYCGLCGREIVDADTR